MKARCENCGRQNNLRPLRAGACASWVCNLCEKIWHAQGFLWSPEARAAEYAATFVRTEP